MVASSNHWHKCSSGFPSGPCMHIFRLASSTFLLGLSSILHLIDVASSTFLLGLSSILHVIDVASSTAWFDARATVTKTSCVLSFLLTIWSILHHVFSSEFANNSANDIAKDFACWMPASLHLVGSRVQSSAAFDLVSPGAHVSVCIALEYIISLHFVSFFSSL